MSKKVDRREFVKASVGVGAATGAMGRPRRAFGRAPAVGTQSVRPVVISDRSGATFRNGGRFSCIERAFDGITSGEDVLDAILAGINIVELDPEESGVGFGGTPNADGVVQLDSCCMHGPRRQAGGVAAIEGVRTPSLVAKAVMEHTDHHLLVGQGAQDFARNMGFTVENDLNTPRTRERWLEWKRRLDPEHYLDPERRARHGYDVALEMLAAGLADESHFWGTVNCDAIGPTGDICGVTSTSGLAWKIPGRTGDSPILGAGLYVDGGVGACGSTGRGEANLYNLTAYLIVEKMREGMHPKDAGLAGLQRIKENTVERRLLKANGDPAFNIRFFALNARGEYAGVSMYAAGETIYGVCAENGAEEAALEPLLDGSPSDA
jgi:N4-(beta-N-acetylglucosaminyl)-L-asparaginase